MLLQSLTCKQANIHQSSLDTAAKVPISGVLEPVEQYHQPNLGLLIWETFRRDKTEGGSFCLLFQAESTLP